MHALVELKSCSVSYYRNMTVEQARKIYDEELFKIWRKIERMYKLKTIYSYHEK
jgi:hypothetical protein